MLAGLLLSGLLAWAAYRRLARPIGQLVAAARQFGEGKLATRVAERPGARDEAELLANAFNQMAAKLEQHVAEVERSQRALAHAEKLHVVGQLAAGVAHEINSPLDGAIEASRMMERNAADKDKVVRFAKAQREGLERIAAIVQTLLTFSRQPKTRETRPLLVSQLLNEAQAILKHRLERKNVALEITDFETKKLIINGDELGLVQVLVNLINNALDATPEGGTIKIDINPGAEKLEISVLDQGSGISADIAPRLFTPFFTTKDVGKGTGLGLATSRNIVEEHGGRIEFCNLTPPWGARFTVLLPSKGRD
jgi:signal transduction histidine kinase